jgi:hypothetical protein
MYKPSSLELGNVSLLKSSEAKQCLPSLTFSKGRKVGLFPTCFRSLQDLKFHAVPVTTETLLSAGCA